MGRFLVFPSNGPSLAPSRPTLAAIHALQPTLAWCPALAAGKRGRARHQQPLHFELPAMPIAGRKVALLRTVWQAECQLFCRALLLMLPPFP
jgi:hypothetical protein